MKTPITEKLDSLQIEYELKPHKQPVYTSEDAARERGVRLSQIVKTMLFMDRNDNMVVFVLPGDKRLNLKKLKNLLGVKDIKFVDKETIEKHTGLVAGAISPISDFFEDVQIIVDPAVFKEAVVDISSGHPCAGVELTSDNLRFLLKKSEIADITK